MPGGPPCRVERVTTVAQLETVGRLRWTVFSEAIGYGLALAPAMREITGFDVCPEANHFIAYVGDEPAGALRVVLPSHWLAERHGCGVGLPMAIDAGFGAIPPNRVIAELGRSAVCRPYRGSPVIGHLMRAAYLMSRSVGVTHWAAASLTTTDDPVDASIIDLLLSHHHHRAGLTTIDGRGLLPDGYLPRRPIFDGRQRSAAFGGNAASLALPRSLNFHLLCGARAAGDAYFDRTICEFLVPIVFDLDDYAASPFGRRYCGYRDADRASPMERSDALLAALGADGRIGSSHARTLVASDI